jgi:hypothetical protein
MKKKTEWVQSVRASGTNGAYWMFDIDGLFGLPMLRLEGCLDPAVMNLGFKPHDPRTSQPLLFVIQAISVQHSPDGSIAPARMHREVSTRTTFGQTFRYPAQTNAFGVIVGQAA